MQYTKDSWSQSDYQDFLSYLKSKTDEKYLEFNKKIVATKEDMLGIRTPELKQISKEIAKGNYREFWQVCGNDYYEEIMIKGFLIGFIKCDFEEICGYIKEFVPLIKNWAVCDCVTANLKQIKKHKEEYFKFIQCYFSSENEFELRFAYISLLDHYIEPDYLENIYEYCDKNMSGYYYVKMAVAWLLSVCYVKFPDRTMIYLNDNRLDDWTYNKTLQKITESNRISPEQKIIIKSMKR